MSRASFSSSFFFLVLFIPLIIYLPHIYFYRCASWGLRFPLNSLKSNLNNTLHDWKIHGWTQIMNAHLVTRDWILKIRFPTIVYFQNKIRIVSFGLKNYKLKITFESYSVSSSNVNTNQHDSQGRVIVFKMWIVLDVISYQQFPTHSSINCFCYSLSHRLINRSKMSNEMIKIVKYFVYFQIIKINKARIYGFEHFDDFAFLGSIFLFVQMFLVNSGMEWC